MFSAIADDIKKFVLEYRGILYFLALALIVDHLLFKDVFRERLTSIIDKIVAKVEEKVGA